ncbi:MAG: hypothetical protein R6X12_07095 [bacterium]
MASKGRFAVVSALAIVLFAMPGAAVAGAAACCPAGAPQVHHFVTLSLFPPVSTNCCSPSDVTTNFALNILGGCVGAVRGLELGTLFNVVTYDAYGVQLVGGTNLVCRDFGGLQLAGILNRAGGNVAGAQLAALNLAGGNVAGIQLGAGNCSGGDNAVQLGAVNLVFGSTGAQIGAANYLRGSGWVQIGAVNIAGMPGETPESGLIRREAPAKLCAVQLGGVNLAGANTGVTIGGVNFAGGDNIVQLGGANIACGSTALQLGGFNVACGHSEPAKSWLVREVTKRSGFQLGGVNYAGASVGAQVGAVNIASEVRWFQLGAFNFARQSDFPVGPLNVILNGQFRVHAFASEAALANFELKTGGPHFYNVLGFGYHPVETARLMLGYGLGVHIPCPCPRLFVDLDAVAYRVNPTDDALGFGGLSYLGKLRVTAGWQVAPPLAITGGLAANAWLSDSEDGSDIPFLPIPMFKSTGDTNIGIWPGVALGVEFRVI